MSRFIGSARQNGYVVPDLDAAMEGWLAAGVGPWYVYPHIQFDDFRHRGVPGELDVSLALANSGSLQLELIVQHDDSPSLYNEFLAVCPQGGLQHLGYWVDDYAETRQRGLDAGWEVGHEGSIWGGEFCYFDNQHHLGTVLEIAAMNADRRAGFARIEQVCSEWNGIDKPVRTITTG
jgi:hypothetical protein